MIQKNLDPSFVDQLKTFVESKSRRIGDLGEYSAGFTNGGGLEVAAANRTRAILA